MNINNHVFIILLAIRNVLILATGGLLLFVIGSQLVNGQNIEGQETLYKDQTEFNTNQPTIIEPDYFNYSTDDIDQTIEDNTKQINDSSCKLLHESNNLKLIDIMLSNTGVLNPSCMNELSNSLIHYTIKGIIQDRYIILETR